MGHLNLQIGIRIVISKKKKLDLNKRKMIYVSVDGWGFVITIQNLDNKILECFKEFKI